jgi:hypothetical protein
MFYKSMLAALLGLSLTGCAVYGGGYDYGYRGHDRYYSNNHYQARRDPVYGVPRYYGHEGRRYDGRRHDVRRYDRRRFDKRRYLPAPPARLSRDERRSMRRIEGRRDYRSAEPRRGWRGQHLKPQERTPRYQRHQEIRRDSRRSSRRRGW